MTQSTIVFDPYSDEFFHNPYDIYRRMRSDAPVYYNPDEDFYALTRHADVAAAFKAHTTFTSTRGLDLTTVRANAPQVKAILFMDPPEHRHMRNLVSRAFTPRAIESQRAMVTERVDRLLAAADPERFDVVADFGAIFPLEVVTRMAGVPEQARRDVQELIDVAVVQREADTEEQREAALKALLETAAYFIGLVQERRADPRDDMISRLIEAEVPREDGELSRLDDVEIAGFVMLVSGAGTETVTKLMGTAATVFAEHPEQWQALLDDRSKVPRAIEELLRYQCPVQYQVRYSVRPFTRHGVTIPAEKPVFLIGASANRDPDAFDDPDTFDIERVPSGAPHLGFGYGVHSCLGAALARLECTVALNALLDFMPRYEVDWAACERSRDPNVFGWNRVPVRVSTQELSDH